MKKVIFALSVLLITVSCTENYSNGNRVGYISKFSKKGLVWSSYEGELQMTQSGNNTAGIFEFSIDNNVNDKKVINALQHALEHSEKVELTYHETKGKNWFGNRGSTNYFVTKVKVLPATN